MASDGATTEALGDSAAVERLLAEGRYPGAEARALAFLNERERSSGPDSTPVANALDLLVEALRRTGKAGDPLTRLHAERSVRIKRQTVGTDSPGYARSLTGLGGILVSTGQYAEAREHLERAETIMERAVGQEHLDLAPILIWRGALEVQTGHPAEALPLLQRALSIRRSHLAPDHRLVGDALNALAATRYQLGDFAEATPLFEEALTLWLRSYGPDHAQVGSCRHNLGALYAELGDHEEARRQLDEALRIRRKKLGPNHPLLGSTLVVLAESEDALGATSPARSHFAEAVPIYQRAYGDSSDRTAWVRMREGLFFLKHGDSAAAEVSLRRAMDAQEHALGPEHHDLGFTLVGLGDIAAGRGEVARAESLYRRAISVQEKGLGPDHPDLVLSLGHLARFQVESGEYRGGLETALEAIRIQEQHVRLTAGGSAERQALSWASERPLAMDAALSSLTRRSPAVTSGETRSVWDALVRTRTVVLDEIVHRQRLAAEAHGDSSLAVAVGNLNDARSKLARSIVQGDPGEARAAREAMERAERALALRSAPYRADEAMARAGLSEILSSLPPGAGLVGFARFGAGDEGGYLAFIARAGREPAHVALGSARDIHARIDRWVAGFRREVPAKGSRAARIEAEHRTDGDKVRASLWDPIAPFLEGLTQCFLVPEGALFRVAFAALPVPDGYLAESGPEIHYLSSERDLARRWPDDRKGRGLLALGGVSFDGGPVASRPSGSRTSRPTTTRSVARADGTKGGCVDLESLRFERLPESLTEVTEIAALWPDSGSALVLTGAKATERALKENAPGRRVLHLATHGFFLEPGCRQSVAGSRGIGATTSGSSQRRAMRTPLLRAGLAFAGANRRAERGRSGEDGILTAEEIASIDLSTVDWAVLSACETGLGVTQTGEGVLGLRRAFLSAGVKTTIMSLWSVDDHATRRWMKLLYEGRFSKGRPTASAVVDASREVLRERRAQALSTHPLYWAAFVAFGDWR